MDWDLTQEELHALPVRVQLRLKTAGDTAQRNVDKASEALAHELQTFNEEFHRLQARSLKKASAMRMLRALASRWSKILEPSSACTKGCSHCCHIPVALSEIEAQVIGEEIGRKPAKVKAHPTQVSRHQPSYGNPCTFLKEGRCSIYASRPMVCRTHLNMDSDDLLCELVEGAPIPVPYANATALLAQYYRLGAGGVFGDIRDFFPPVKR